MTAIPEYPTPADLPAAFVFSPAWGVTRDAQTPDAVYAAMIAARPWWAQLPVAWVKSVKMLYIGGEWKAQG